MSTGVPRFVIDAPPSLAGDYDESISLKFNWTESFKEALYQKHRFGGHQGICRSERTGETITVPDQKYPANLIEYQPVDKCAQRK